MERTLELNRTLAGLLATHEDYSMWATLCRLRSVTDTNPDFETTLKRNAENNYCRSYIFENAQYLYVPEMEILFDEVKKAKNGSPDREAISARAAENRRRYYEIPLEKMNEIDRRGVSELLYWAAELIDGFGF